VKGRGSSGGGQDANDKQTVEWRRSCKRSYTYTDAWFVSKDDCGAPGLDLGGSRRQMATPSRRDTWVNERLCEWYLRWLRWAVIPIDAGLS
jgi:hypothetical protein